MSGNLAFRTIPVSEARTATQIDRLAAGRRIVLVDVHTPVGGPQRFSLSEAVKAAGARLVPHSLEMAMVIGGDCRFSDGARGTVSVKTSAMEIGHSELILLRAVEPMATAESRVTVSLTCRAGLSDADQMTIKDLSSLRLLVACREESAGEHSFVLVPGQDISFDSVLRHLGTDYQTFIARFGEEGQRDVAISYTTTGASPTRVVAKRKLLSEDGRTVCRWEQNPVISARTEIMVHRAEFMVAAHSGYRIEVVEDHARM